MSDVIHLYCHHDRSFVLDVFRQNVLIKHILITSQEGEQGVVQSLQRCARAKMILHVFLSEEDIFSVDTSLPARFSDDDILQYISLEQAKLFPMLDEKIYVDFFKISEDSENYKLSIVACNAKSLVFLQGLCVFLKLRWQYLGLQQAQSIYNLLPWRALTEKAYKKKFLKIIVIFTFSFGFVLLLLSIFLFSILQKDKQQERIYDSVVTSIRPKLIELEKTNDQYQQIFKQWKHQEKMVEQQFQLAQILLLIEPQPLDHVEIIKIVYEKNIIKILGKAREIQQVDRYLERFYQDIHANLLFVGHADDNIFPVQFEIEGVVA